MQEKRRNKWVAFLLTLCMIFGLVPVDAKAADTTYDLWVGSIQVTDTNKDDVLGDADEGATVKYDPDTSTLTLNNAYITTAHTVSGNKVGIYTT